MGIGGRDAIWEGPLDEPRKTVIQQNLARVWPEVHYEPDTLSLSGFFAFRNRDTRDLWDTDGDVDQDGLIWVFSHGRDTHFVFGDSERTLISDVMRGSGA
jgi:hypothetical protein